MQVSNMKMHLLRCGRFIFRFSNSFRSNSRIVEPAGSMISGGGLSCTSVNTTKEPVVAWKRPSDAYSHAINCPNTTSYCPVSHPSELLLNFVQVVVLIRAVHVKYVHKVRVGITFDVGDALRAPNAKSK